MNTSEWIKEKRTENKISQEKLGAKLGYSQHAISKYERGITQPTIETFCSIADALGYQIQIVKKEN